ncbi:MAG: pilus assembly protein PilP [Immundisolibacter sp.]|uniref:pilus assembly protein PilP n=1 Tax=Immundisolibacter sp. TaxID=1934948 RepID=UPI003EE0EB7C
MNGGRILGLGLLCAIASGCGARNADLHAWMDEVRAAEKVAIDPLPVLKPYEQFVYVREGIKNPFLDTLEDPRLAQRADTGEDGGIRPDLNRRKEALEGYPLDALRMVGTLGRDGSVWALVQGPDQTISRIGVGNYLGENYGRVSQVEETAVKLVELIPNGTGGWMERAAAIAIVEQ